MLHFSNRGSTFLRINFYLFLKEDLSFKTIIDKSSRFWDVEVSPETVIFLERERAKEEVELLKVVYFNSFIVLMEDLFFSSTDGLFLERCFLVATPSFLRASSPETGASNP